LTTSTKDYWLQLRAMGRQMSLRFGFDLRRAPVEIRGLAALTAGQFAILMKLLVDKGVLTDADLQAAFLDARDNNPWEVEPLTETVPEDPPPDPPLAP
jgi:hypothetical protein